SVLAPKELDAGARHRALDGGTIRRAGATPAAEVWKAPERDVLLDTERKSQLVALRDDGDALREAHAITDRLAIEEDAPRREVHAPEQRAHERALPAPVGPDDGGEAATRRLEPHAGERVVRRAWVADNDVLVANHTRRRRRAR